MNSKTLISSNEEDLNNRFFWLRNRFMILDWFTQFTVDERVNWAHGVVSRDANWTARQYLKAYNSESN